MEMSVKRYEIDVIGDVCGPRFEMAEHPTGDYVYYEDYAALDAEVAGLRRACSLVVRQLDMNYAITPDHSDDRIYDELPSSGIAAAYFTCRAALTQPEQDDE